MTATDARSPDAQRARQLVDELQQRFVTRLEHVSASDVFQRVTWLRDDGRHGGGNRLVAVDTAVFNRAAINVSQVHYHDEDDDPKRRLASATALSTIIHPQSPLAPSVHMHISWTEMRDGSAYWRVMGDLNPAIPDDAATERFRDAMRTATPEHYEAAAAQGDRYFLIPAIGRRRGVTHYYLEGFSSGDRDADLTMARRFGEAVIDAYATELEASLSGAASPSGDQRRQQLEYHTMYVFQVLTLDRGTTSGLLVHDQNDVGILGSLPCRIDRALFESWADRVDSPQDQLVRAIVSALPDSNPCELTDELRAELAAIVRAHYRAHPEALSMQASGDIAVPTVDNHLAPG